MGPDMLRKESIRLGVRRSRFKARHSQTRGTCRAFFKGRREMVRRGKMVLGDRTESSRTTFVRQLSRIR